jgi:hypothetical protein
MIGRNSFQILDEDLLTATPNLWHLYVNQIVVTASVYRMFWSLLGWHRDFGQTTDLGKGSAYITPNIFPARILWPLTKVTRLELDGCEIHYFPQDFFKSQTALKKL